MTDTRAQIRADLERRRLLDVEARALRARLDQLAPERAQLSVAVIANRHGVTAALVQSIAKGLCWTEEEKQRPTVPYLTLFHPSIK